MNKRRVKVADNVVQVQVWSLRMRAGGWWGLTWQKVQGQEDKIWGWNEIFWYEDEFIVNSVFVYTGSIFYTSETLKANKGEHGILILQVSV